jgi:uncharacterized protein (UPF0371 family)
MNKKVAHIINSLIADDMDEFKKLKKTELLELVKNMQVSLYLEMTDDTLDDIYQKRYNDIIDNMWGPYNRGVL